jgi:LPXTG-motif cell wall-anchored protein
VQVSISSPDPLVTIIGCVAGFVRDAVRECVGSGGVWSVMLQVPADAAPGSIDIGATIASSEPDPDGRRRGEKTVTVPFTVVLPTRPSSATTGSTPTTVVAPTTVTPSTVPETPPSSGGTSNLWILVLVLVLVLLALTAALVGRRSRRRPRPPERVQARLRDGPAAAPRIEQLSERPAWVLRIDPHHDRATERVEEMQR